MITVCWPLASVVVIVVKILDERNVLESSSEGEAVDNAENSDSKGELVDAPSPVPRRVVVASLVDEAVGASSGVVIDSVGTPVTSPERVADDWTSVLGAEGVG